MSERDEEEGGGRKMEDGGGAMCICVCGRSQTLDLRLESLKLETRSQVLDLAAAVGK